MFIEAIVIGLVIGLILKGKILNLNNIKFNGFPILLGIIAIDLILRQFIVRSNSQMALTMFSLYPKFNIVVYFITIVILGLNNHLKHMREIQAGYVLNFLPMFANEGKMPVSADAMISIGKSMEVEFLNKNLYLGHSLMNESTRFKALCDTIPISFPIPKVISLGDIAISIGLILFIIYYMRNEKNVK